MSIRTILLNLHSFDKSAAIMFDHRHIVPGLTLIYTGIDIVASLERLGHEGTKHSFIRWCENYLLKAHQLPCTSTDLYSARCGILHAHSAESDLSRAGKARKLYYAWGTASEATLDEVAKHSKQTGIVNVHVNDLREAFRSGIEEWAKAVQNDSTRTTKVEKRSRLWLINLPIEMMDQALESTPREY